nr:hypothetical protein [uncultured Pseudoxanthomonas sp.]
MRTFIAVVVVALLAFAYFFIRSSDEAPVVHDVAEASRAIDTPSQEAPAVISVGPSDVTESPASMQAAAERSTHARSCAFALRTKASIDAQLKVCEGHDELRSNPEHAEFFASCDRRAKEFADQLDPLISTLKTCKQVDQQQAETEFYEATKAAALKGDIDAQLCYTQATFFSSHVWTDAEKAAYKKNATSFIDAGFKRGDWRFVEVLRLATPNVIAQSGLLGQVATGDRGEIYRYNRLLRLGAGTVEYQNSLEALSDDPGAPLPIDVRRQGDEWAERTYNTSFRRSPRLSAPPKTCSEVNSI